ncbi:Protein ACTIVITY OF BC1 COMPLEX KINASE 7 chloroplastic [Bienertia sinuspersici]
MQFKTLISALLFLYGKKLASFIKSERAARKATILQMATMYTVLGGTLLNLGVTFTSQGTQIAANGSFVGAVQWQLPDEIGRGVHNYFHDDGNFIGTTGMKSLKMRS